MTRLVAISVHGVCGALGTLFTGIFGEGCSFITQLIGFVAVAAYTLILAFILFFVLKKTIGLRVTEKEEIDGLGYARARMQRLCKLPLPQ